MGQYERDSFRGAGCAVASLAMGMLIVFLLSLLMSGCRTRYITQEIPVVLHDRDSVVSVQHIHTHDTLMMRDSVYHYVQGDTIRIERWHTLQSVNHIARIDTLWRERIVEQPVQVTTTELREVNHLYWWQKCLMWCGGIALLIGGAGAWWKFRRR